MKLEKKNSLAPAVDRAYSLLDLLAKNPRQTMSLTEISTELSIAKSSISNICGSLEHSGLIEKKHDGYKLGRQILFLASAYLSGFNQISEFYRLCAESPLLQYESVQMAILDGIDVLYVAKHMGSSSLRYTAEVGDRLPASVTALGKVLLAELSEPHFDMLYKNTVLMPKFTSKSTSSFNELKMKIQQVRTQGYAIDNGEVFPNVVGLAIAVPSWRQGCEVMAIGVSMMSFEQFDKSDDRQQHLMEELKSIAERLSNPLLKK